MPLIQQAFIKREDLRANPDVLYVFGDNLQQEGYGGQAKEMRGEPNAVGIPTKKRPSTHPSAFFKDSDYNEAARAISERLAVLQEHLSKGGIVVWPLDGIGTGRAYLKENAPQIAGLVERAFKVLSTTPARQRA